MCSTSSDTNSRASGSRALLIGCATGSGLGLPQRGTSGPEYTIRHRPGGAAAALPPVRAGFSRKRPAVKVSLRLGCEPVSPDLARSFIGGVLSRCGFPDPLSRPLRAGQRDRHQCSDARKVCRGLGGHRRPPEGAGRGRRRRCIRPCDNPTRRSPGSAEASQMPPRTRRHRGRTSALSGPPPGPSCRRAAATPLGWLPDPGPGTAVPEEPLRPRPVSLACHLQRWRPRAPWPGVPGQRPFIGTRSRPGANTPWGADALPHRRRGQSP